MASKYSQEQYFADEILLEHIYLYAGYEVDDLNSLKKAVRQGDLSMESMVENAISKVGNLERTSQMGMDFTDGSDAKKTTVVNQGTIKNPNRGAGFSTKNKKGTIRVVVVDPLIREVFYFKVPPSFYLGVEQKRRELGLRIMFSKNGGPPVSLGKNSNNNLIWTYRVHSFEALCN